MRKILSVVLLLWAVNAIAQQQVQLSQFFADYTFFNPAFAGRSFQTDATIIHREQWVGLNGAPSSTLASVNTRIPRSTLGAGLNVFNDVIGNFRTVGLRLAIGSEKRFGLNSVRFALAPSFYSTTLSRNFNPADDVSTDPTLQKAGISASNFDLNLGLLYQAPDYFVGISVVNLLAPRLEQLAAQNTRTLFVTGGVEFRSSPIENLRFLPTFLIPLPILFPIFLNFPIIFSS
ncbi:MAG: PorP/SprF family type IX secretion system membrane protein [Luteibaculum sp.]